MIKLRSCPFCGGEVNFEDYGQPGEFEDWAIYCKSCGIVMLAPGPEEGAISTMEDAEKAWNRRIIPKEAKILANSLDGTPLCFPCVKLWSPNGWCEEHCNSDAPNAECWLHYAEVIAHE